MFLIDSIDTIQARDLLVDEAGDVSADVKGSTIATLLTRGWSVERILAEIPTVSEGDVRAVRASLPAN